MGRREQDPSAAALIELAPRERESRNGEMVGVDAVALPQPQRRSSADVIDITVRLKQRETFSRLYAETYRAAVNKARQWTGDQTTAEEVVQDVFANIFEKYPNSPFDELRTMLFASVPRACIDFAKSAAERYRKLSCDIEDHDVAPRDDATPETTLLNREQIQIVENVLRKMPARRRKCFVMAKVDGYSQEHIAAELRMSQSSVCRALEKAMVEINDALDAADEIQ